MKAAAIGNFDGLHRGHIHLLNFLKTEAKKRGMTPAVITFSSHPLALVNPSAMPALLTPPNERAELLANEGMEVISLKFTPELRQMTAEEFLQFIRREFSVGLLVMGFNNRIGSNRLSGNDPSLRAAARNCGMEIDIAPELGNEGISSSTIRAMIAEGNVRQASRLLGRPYSIEGKVVTGQQLGRTIGFPTANIRLEPTVAIPAPGVYLCKVGDRKAVTNVGRRPTVDNRTNAPLSIEVHLLDYHGDLYGKTLRVEFIDRLRGERKFANLEELKQAIANDVATAHERNI